MLLHKMEAWGQYLEKAEESLGAAQSLRSKGKNNSAVSRARYAVHQAQLAALLKFFPLKGAPETWHRKAVQVRFAKRLISHKRMFREEITEQTIELESLRTTADYWPATISAAETARAVRYAERIVADIKAAIHGKGK